MMISKRFLDFAVVLLVIVAITSGCGAVDNYVEDEAVDIEAAKTAFLSWEARVNEIYTAADEVMGAYNKAVSGVAEGNIDIFSVYDYISSEVVPANEKLEMAMDLVNADHALSKNHQETLNSAKSDFTHGIYWRTKAYKRFLEFLDNQKLSLMDDARGDFEFANDCMLEGIAKYMGVKSELGLLEEEQ